MNRKGTIMGKAIRNDHEYNKEAFTELLNKAKGKRSQTEFAKDCDVSVAYMCKFLNQKFEHSPNPSTIKKIAACADNGVTLVELLDLAGYDPEKYMDSDAMPDKMGEKKKHVIAAVTTALVSSSFKWTSVNRKEFSLSDFSIDVEENGISRWNFFYIDDIPKNPTEIQLQNKLMTYYGKILFMKEKAIPKYTFLTYRKEIFDCLLQLNPHSLYGYVSVILVDTDSMSMMDEKYLETAVHVDHDLQESFCLKQSF